MSIDWRLFSMAYATEEWEKEFDSYDWYVVLCLQVFAVSSAGSKLNLDLHRMEKNFYINEGVMHATRTGNTRYY